MSWPDEKIVAMLVLMLIAIAVIFKTGETGLDVIINIVCAIGGFVTGIAVERKQ